MTNDLHPHVTLEEAKELGLKRYYSAKPCKRGHTSARLVSSRGCIECHNHAKTIRCNNDPSIAIIFSIRHRSKISGLPFDLTSADIDLSGNCPVCSTPFERIPHGHSQGRNFTNLDPTSPTIDRVDNDIGYIRSNTKVICAECNMTKSNLTAPQARARASRLLLIADFIDAHLAKVAKDQKDQKDQKGPPK